MRSIPFNLMLIAGDKEESIPFAGGEFSAAVAIGQPDAVDWQPPVLAASRLRLHNIPVFSIPVGSRTRLPDVELLSLDAPTFGIAFP